MYNEELERLINAALSDGKITDSERRALEKKAKLLGVDLDELNLEITTRLLEMRYGKSTFSASEIQEIVASQDAKKYIDDLIMKLGKAEVYAPTGKYGKMELDPFETYKKKREVIMSEKPSTPEQLKELILFLEGLQDYGCFVKIRSLIENTDKETINSPILKDVVKKMNKMYNKEKRKYNMAIIGKVAFYLLIVGIIVGNVFSWISSINLVAKLLITLIGSPIIMFILYEKHYQKCKDEIYRWHKKWG